MGLGISGEEKEEVGIRLRIHLGTPVRRYVRSLHNRSIAKLSASADGVDVMSAVILHVWHHLACPCGGGEPQHWDALHGFQEHTIWRQVLRRIQLRCVCVHLSRAHHHGRPHLGNEAEHFGHFLGRRDQSEERVAVHAFRKLLLEAEVVLEGELEGIAGRTAVHEELGHLIPHAIGLVHERVCPHLSSRVRHVYNSLLQHLLRYHLLLHLGGEERQVYSHAHLLKTRHTLKGALRSTFS
mmetsp:Transcript_64662/g.151575  ORF Transcript_64662/g.151575 Transcript_64662/m.151575 type:complete len:239 (-) Transcript_64662:87-803(-)